MFPQEGWDYALLAAEITDFMNEPFSTAIVLAVLSFAVVLLALRSLLAFTQGD